LDCFAKPAAKRPRSKSKYSISEQCRPSSRYRKTKNERADQRNATQNQCCLTHDAPHTSSPSIRRAISTRGCDGHHTVAASLQRLLWIRSHFRPANAPQRPNVRRDMSSECGLVKRPTHRRSEGMAFYSAIICWLIFNGLFVLAMLLLSWGGRRGRPDAPAE
jgi:hypothetical protein